MSDKHSTTGNSAPSGGKAEVPQDVKAATRATWNFWTGLGVGAALVTAMLLLIVQNERTVRMHWLIFDFTAPLWLFLLASALSGGILILLALPLSRWAHARALRRRAATRRLRQLGSQ